MGPSGGQVHRRLKDSNAVQIYCDPRPFRMESPAESGPKFFPARVVRGPALYSRAPFNWRRRMSRGTGLTRVPQATQLSTRGVPIRVWNNLKITKLYKGVRPLPEDLTTTTAVGSRMCTATPVESELCRKLSASTWSIHPVMPYLWPHIWLPLTSILLQEFASKEHANQHSRNLSLPAARRSQQSPAELRATGLPRATASYACPSTAGGPSACAAATTPTPQPSTPQ